jgi:hypothetical protein
VEYDIVLRRSDESAPAVSTVLVFESDTNSLTGVRIATEKQNLSLSLPDAVQAWNDLRRAIVAATHIDPSLHALRDHGDWAGDDTRGGMH